jgi:hypothetical protein
VNQIQWQRTEASTRTYATSVMTTKLTKSSSRSTGLRWGWKGTRSGNGGEEDEDGREQLIKMARRGREGGARTFLPSHASTREAAAAAENRSGGDEESRALKERDLISFPVVQEREGKMHRGGLAPRGPTISNTSNCGWGRRAGLLAYQTRPRP